MRKLKTKNQIVKRRKGVHTIDSEDIDIGLLGCSAVKMETDNPPKRIYLEVHTALLPNTVPLRVLNLHDQGSIFLRGVQPAWLGVTLLQEWSTTQQWPRITITYMMWSEEHTFWMPRYTIEWAFTISSRLIYILNTKTFLPKIILQFQKRSII